MKVVRTCKYCGDKFNARSADVKRGWAKFCSKSCKAKEQEKRTGQHAAYKAGFCIDAAEQGWDSHKDQYK